MFYKIKKKHVYKTLSIKLDLSIKLINNDIFSFYLFYDIISTQTFSEI